MMYAKYLIFIEIFLFLIIFHKTICKKKKITKNNFENHCLKMKNMSFKKKKNFKRDFPMIIYRGKKILVQLT